MTVISFPDLNNSRFYGEYEDGRETFVLYDLQYARECYSFWNSERIRVHHPGHSAAFWAGVIHGHELAERG